MDLGVLSVCLSIKVRVTIVSNLENATAKHWKEPSKAIWDLSQDTKWVLRPQNRIACCPAR